MVQNESVKATLEGINQMQPDDIIGKYTIGGGVGAPFLSGTSGNSGLGHFRCSAGGIGGSPSEFDSNLRVLKEPRLQRTG